MPTTFLQSLWCKCRSFWYTWVELQEESGKTFHHGSINDIIHHLLSSAGVLSRLETQGLFQSDGKRPDGMSIIPWSSGRLLVWDATCGDTFFLLQPFCSCHQDWCSCTPGRKVEE